MADRFANRIIKGWIPSLGIPALFVLAAFIGAYPALLDLPLCGVRLFIGIPCPGCGLTHAFAALASGDVRASISCNPMGIVIALWLIYQWLRVMSYSISGTWPKPILSDGPRFFVLNVFVAGLMLQWIAGFIIPLVI